MTFTHSYILVHGSGMFSSHGDHKFLIRNGKIAVDKWVIITNIYSISIFIVAN